LTSYGLDIKYGITIVEPLNTSRNKAEADDVDTQIATGSFDIVGVLFYEKEETETPLVQDLIVEYKLKKNKKDKMNNRDKLKHI